MQNDLSQNELDKHAMGGTELMVQRVHKYVNPDLLKDVQIVCSRFRGFDESKKYHVFWEHDLPNDPESTRIFQNPDIMNGFDRFVFISRWQRDHFLETFPLLRTQEIRAKSVLIRNAVEAFDLSNRKYMANGKLNLIYISTPHRGLQILVPVFTQLAKDFPGALHLDVYSSFKIYGWEERDQPYEPLFKAIDDHPDMTNHGSVPNDDIRKALLQADILAFPSIWQENSCLSMIESMSAGCLHVCSDLASLPENCGDLPYVYPFNPDLQIHGQHFYVLMHKIIELFLDHPDTLSTSNVCVVASRMYSDLMYGIENMRYAWEVLLNTVMIND